MKTRTVWALHRNSGPGFLTASGNFLAPWIFPNREAARNAARECREHGIDVSPVRIVHPVGRYFRRAAVRQ